MSFFSEFGGAPIFFPSTASRGKQKTQHNTNSNRHKHKKHNRNNNKPQQNKNKDKKKNKGIYGNASREEIKDLRDEGIDTEVIPWIEDKNN